MVRRKSWLEPPSLKLLSEANSYNSDISWSSSSSEAEEVNYKYIKKMKINWKLDDFEAFGTQQKGEITPTKYSNQEESVSPVIGHNLIRDVSPSLNGNCNINTSPVIGKSLKKKLVRRQNLNRNLISPRSHDNKFKFMDESPSENILCTISSDASPDNSLNEDNYSISLCTNTVSIHKQSDKELTDDSSQISVDMFSQCSEQMGTDFISSNSQSSKSIPISQFTSTQESQYSKDNILTQNTNKLSIHFASDTQPCSTSQRILCYRKIQKKKRYKKGGLAKQLQRVLHSKQAIISIWKHELYVNKLNYEEYLYLQVLKISVEFKISVCECDFISENIGWDKKDKCIVVLSMENIKCLQKLKLYKPYSVSNINYFGQDLPCYYNTCKILLE